MLRATIALALSLPVAYVAVSYAVGSGIEKDGPIQLVVQSDDMAVGHGANVGTIQAYREGIVRTTNVIATGGWLPEAARLLKENSGLDVGVHLALTSEWDNLKWRPLTIAPSLVDENGYLLPTVHRTSGFPARSSMAEADLDLEEAENELRAQIELVKKMMPQTTYVWPHMDFTSVSREMRAMVLRLAEEYGLVVPGPDIGVEIIAEVYETTDPVPVRVEKLTRLLRDLDPGTWMIFDHAGTDSPEIRAFGHPGYRMVASDRNAAVETWTSPAVLREIQNRGIRLTNYRQLLARTSHSNSLPVQ